MSHMIFARVSPADLESLDRYCAEHGLERSAVMRLALREQLKRLPPTGMTRSGIDPVDLAARRDKGESIGEIAASIGRSERTVYRLIGLSGS